MPPQEQTWHCNTQSLTTHMFNPTPHAHLHLAGDGHAAAVQNRHAHSGGLKEMVQKRYAQLRRQQWPQYIISITSCHWWRPDSSSVQTDGDSGSAARGSGITSRAPRYLPDACSAPAAACSVGWPEKVTAGARAHMNYLGFVPFTLQGPHCSFHGALRPLPGLKKLHWVAADWIQLMFSHDGLKLVHNIFASNILQQPEDISSGGRILPAHREAPRCTMTKFSR